MLNNENNFSKKDEYIFTYLGNIQKLLTWQYKMQHRFYSFISIVILVSILFPVITFYIFFK